MGIELIRSRTAGTLKICQPRMIRELLTKYGMLQVKPRTTPLSASIKLVKEPGELLDTIQFPYSELIGSLLYLAVCTRPDIAQAVGALARYMSAPAEQHWSAAKGVVHYLASTAGRKSSLTTSALQTTRRTASPRHFQTSSLWPAA